MKQRWLHKVLPKDKPTVKADILASREVLKRLSTLVQEDLDLSVKAMSSRDQFKDPAWAEKMAHYLGEQAAYRKLIEFLKIED